jgi:hypothetical protein
MRVSVRGRSCDVVLHSGILPSTKFVLDAPGYDGVVSLIGYLADAGATRVCDVVCTSALNYRTHTSSMAALTCRAHTPSMSTVVHRTHTLSMAALTRHAHTLSVCACA